MLSLKKSVKIRSIAIAMVLFFIVSIIMPAKVDAATASLRFINLPLNNAIQNFHTVDDQMPANGKEIYVTQRTGNNTYLSRCIVEYNASYGQYVGRVLDYAILNGYGHGESLEISRHNGINYIWVGADGDTAGSNCWSTQIARLQYVPNPNGGVASVTNARFLHHLRWASKTGGVLESGSVTRVSVASTSTSHNRMVFRVQVNNASGKKSVHYSVYDYNAVNRALDGSSSVHMQNLASSNKSHFKMNTNSILPRDDSYQGHEAVGVGTDQKYLYIAGGTLKDASPQIGTYLYTNGGNVTRKSMTTLSEFGGKEIEGLQAVGGYLLFVIKPASDNHNGHFLYYMNRPT